MKTQKSTIAVGLLVLLTGAAWAAPDIEEVLDASPGELLEIDIETGGDVEIAGWDANQVAVEADGDDSDRQEITIKRTDRGVLIHVESSRRFRREGVDLSIRVPRRFDLEIETMGGDVEIDGIEGTIRGETMGGDLELSNLAGSLEFTTMGGDIELTDSQVDGEVETMGGDVLLQNITGDVDGSSMGGDVIYKNVTRPDGSSTGEAVVITTMGGDIELSEAMAGAELETMGGDIELGRAAVYVEAQTMGGDIELDSVDGRVNATTMGGDVEVTIVGDPQASDRDIEIESKGGDIYLTVPRNFSMEVDIELAYTKGRQDKYKIVSDVDLAISESDSWTRIFGSPRKIINGTGSFNGGRNKVEISTINGDIHLEYAD